MELWRVAHLAEHLRSDAPIGEKYAVLEAFVQSHDDWMEAIVLLYHDSPSVGVGWFTSRAPRFFGIHVEEWLELTRESLLSPLLHLNPILLKAHGLLTTHSPFCHRLKREH